MKVAHLIQRLFTGIGGMEVCLHNICQRHSQKGMDVFVFCGDANLLKMSTGYPIKKLINFRAITQLYPLSKFLIVTNVAYLQKKLKFDIWQIYGGYPYGAFLADYFIKNKIPCVLRCSGDDIQIDDRLGYGVRRSPKINHIIANNYFKYSAVVAITDTVRQEYLKLGVPEKHITLIPNGVDVNRFKKISNVDIRKKHNIPPQALILLSVGRNHPKKGYDFIPAILRTVLDYGIDTYWIIIGRKSNELKNYPGFSAFAKRLIFLDQIKAGSSAYEIPSNELIGYYQNADLFAMTSLLETFGIVLIEAMAAGLPVVCFDAPGIRDVMTPDCGTICPHRDVEAYAQAIIQLAPKKNRTELPGNCIRNAEQYSWDSIAEQYLTVYKTLLR